MGEFVTIREFARRAACDDKQVRRAISLGRISMTSERLIDVGQLDSGWRRANRRAMPGARGYAAKARTRGADMADLSAFSGADNSILSASRDQAEVVRTVDMLRRATDAFGAKLEGSGFDRFLADMLEGKFASLPDALRIKENALALKHLLAARLDAERLLRLTTSGGES